jgi:peptidyl-prolyl cis-trans isomerase D
MKNIKKIDKITNDEILQYYDINKKNFVNPERRVISYLTVNIEKISQQITINDEQALQFYKNNIAQYQTQQSRDIFQAIFDNKKQAEIFLNKFEQEINVKDKKSVFIKYSKNILNKDKKSIEIKNITQDQLVPELIDKIFSLKINDHSKVVKTPLGYHIILLNKINKPYNKEFKIVKKDIIAQLKQQKTKEVIQKKLVEVEEDMILNNSIKKTATKFELKYSKKPININISGQDINNKIPTIIVQNNNLLEQIFSLQEDQFSQPIISKDQKYYYIIKINKIIPQHQKGLETVKSEIASIIKNNKFNDELEILGQKIFHDLENNTKNINNIAKKYSAKLIKNKKIKRTDSTFGLLNKEIFKLNINQISSPLMIENNKFYIALLRKIHETPIKNSEKSAILENDKYRFKSEIMQQFNKYISNKYHIKINPKYKP